METNELLKKLEGIFEEVIDEGEVSLSNDTVADDIEGWDSLSHMEIIVGIETEFGLRFSSVEVEGLKNVGDMCTLIQSKMQ